MRALRLVDVREIHIEAGDVRLPTPYALVREVQLFMEEQARSITCNNHVVSDGKQETDRHRR